jgi:hypothetical protein
MTRSADTLKTRELAQRLLAYEAAEAATANPETQAVYRVCEKLRRPITLLAGAAGFRSLLTRALNLSKRESPLLDAWEVRSDGSLQGLHDETVQVGAVLVSHLLGLMITFIGESLTMRLLHDVWLDLPNAEAKLEKDESK